MPNLDVLIGESIPAGIRRAPLDLPEGVSEHRYLRELRETASRNQVFTSYIGLGYYGCVTPPVIQRNVIENPGWYTPYTPYQAEIAQGRLEAMLNFQTMVANLTGMEIANASLLDEATAAAEAMTMLHRLQARTRSGEAATRFFVADTCFPQTIDVLRTRAAPLGLELVIGDPATVTFTSQMFGALVQTPDEAGVVHELTSFIRRAHDAGVRVAVATDLLALTLLVPPGELGADVVVGSAQRFGVPMGYGGPHAGVLRDEDGARATDARTARRSVCRRARQDGVSHGPSDARAAYPPREGDLEHLHGRRHCWRISPDSMRSITVHAASRRSLSVSTNARRRWPERS